MGMLGRGDEKAAAAGVGRRVFLACREGLAAGGGAGQCVVVAVGARPGFVQDDPTKVSHRPAGQDAAGEGADHGVAGQSVNPLDLALSVDGSDSLDQSRLLVLTGVGQS